MDMKGEQRIQARKDAVWAALNDTTILAACIPGCQELTRVSDTEMAAIAVIKVGPVTASFKGAVTFSDIDPPNGYRISGEGQGGVAGFAKGTALVHLREEDGATILSYEVSAQVGGKLSQLGGRLIDMTAKQLSNAFFKRFAQELQAPSEGAKAAAGARATALSGRGVAGRGTPPDSGGMSWAQALIVALVGGAVGAGVMAWGLLGGLGAERAAGLSPDFVAACLCLLFGGLGYLWGQRRGDPDPRLIAGIVAALEQRQAQAGAESTGPRHS